MVLFTGNVSERRNTFRSSLLFTEINRISLYHLLRYTSTKLRNEIVDCLFVRIHSGKDRIHLTSHRTKRFFHKNGKLENCTVSSIWLKILTGFSTQMKAVPDFQETLAPRGLLEPSQWFNHNFLIQVSVSCAKYSL